MEAVRDDVFAQARLDLAVHGQRVADAYYAQARFALKSLRDVSVADEVSTTDDDGGES